MDWDLELLRRQIRVEIALACEVSREAGILQKQNDYYQDAIDTATMQILSLVGVEPVGVSSKEGQNP